MLIARHIHKCAYAACVRACVCCASPKYALIIGSCVPWVVRSQYSDGAVLLLSNEITQHAHTRHIRTLYTSSSNNNHHRKKYAKNVFSCATERARALSKHGLNALCALRVPINHGGLRKIVWHILNAFCVRAHSPCV